MLKKSFTLLTLFLTLSSIAQKEDPMGLWEIRIADPAVALENATPKSIHTNVAKVEAMVKDRFVIKVDRIDLGETEVENHLYGQQATYTSSQTGFGINGEGIYVNGIGAQIKFQSIKPRAHKRVRLDIPKIEKLVIQDMAGDDDNKDVGITLKSKGQTVLPLPKSIDLELYSDTSGNHLRLANSKAVLAGVADEISALFGADKFGKTFEHELRNPERQKNIGTYLKALHPELNGLAKKRLDELLGSEEAIFSTLFARLLTAMPNLPQYSKERPLALTLKFEKGTITVRASDSTSSTPEATLKALAAEKTPSNTAVILLDPKSYGYLVSSELSRIQQLKKFTANGFELNSDAEALTLTPKDNDDAKAIAEFFASQSKAVDATSSYIVALSTKNALKVNPFLSPRGNFLTVNVPFSLYEKDLSGKAIAVAVECQIKLGDDGATKITVPTKMPAAIEAQLTSLLLTSVLSSDTVNAMAKLGRKPISRYRIYGNAGEHFSGAKSQWARVIAIDVTP